MSYSQSGTAIATRKTRKKKVDERRVIDKRTGRDVTPVPLTVVPYVPAVRVSSHPRGGILGGGGGGGGGAVGMSGMLQAQSYMSNTSYASTLPTDRTGMASSRYGAHDHSAAEEKESFAGFDLIRNGFSSISVAESDGSNGQNGGDTDRTNVNVDGDRYAADQGGVSSSPADSVDKPLQQWELETRHTVLLSETPTIYIFALPSTRVWEEDVEAAQATIADNKRYAATKEKKKEKDKFTSTAIQTINGNFREKSAQTLAANVVDAAVSVGESDIYDCFHHSSGAGHAPWTASGTGADDEAIEAELERRQAAANDNNDNDNGASAADPASASSTARRSVNSSAVNGGTTNRSDNASISQSSISVSQSQSRSTMISRRHDSNQFENAAALASATTSAIVDSFIATDSFKSALRSLEEAVMQNTLHQQQLLYRNYQTQDINPTTNTTTGATATVINESATTNDNTPATETTTEEGTPTAEVETTPSAGDETTATQPQTTQQAPPLSRTTSAGIVADNRPQLIPLWSFSCSLTKGRNVSAMSWNKHNTDLLAATYGSYHFGHDSGGLICFWSLKNPSFPHRTIRTISSVLCVDWSDEHPSLCAVGMYDGTVAVYDVRDNTTMTTSSNSNSSTETTTYDRPVMQSTHESGKHSECVWGVQWVGQSLMSVSSDGLIMQWSMKKGLVPKPIMTLKRVLNVAQFAPAISAEGLSRTASALCFDFSRADPSQYFVGTEDGVVHRCSSSYNEQTLSNHFGHTNAIYSLKTSPFLADTFLTASADWSCALWTARNEQSVLKFCSGHDYIMSAEWSPMNATVFASVSRDGHVEVWEIDHSALDPAIQLNTETSLSTVKFSPNGCVLLTGGNDGTIELYRIGGIDGLHGAGQTLEEQAARLDEVMYQLLRSNE